MKKLLLSIMALAVSATMFAGDVLYKTLTFPDGNSEEISSYEKTWTATCEDLTWTIINFNNNKNAWSYIKCGRKNNASVANISTPQIEETITKVVITVDACTASKVKASYLEVASDEAFTQDLQKVDAAIATGDVIYTVPSAKPNQYYRLTFDCAEGSSNGLITISKVQLYKYDVSSVSAPVIAPKGGAIYEPTNVTISADAGSDIYYSIDGKTFVKYTEAITVAESMTIQAYAQNGEAKSETVSSEYIMATQFSSVEELLKTTPSNNPVAVKLNGDAIKGFAKNGQYVNGVYLNYQVNGKDFELYCRDVPSTWKEGDLLNGIAKGIYQEYKNNNQESSAIWEISLVSWDGITVESVLPDGPTITPATGTYEEAQTVTITDPSGSNYTIYYTIDGSEPENGGDNSVLYEGPFTVSETTTVKASTYDDDDNLVGTTTVVITINKVEAITSIADLIAACTATSQNDAPVVSFSASNLLVTGVNGSNVFVQDAKGSFMLYGSASNLKKGDIISGTIEGKLYSYNGLPELSVTDKWANIKVESQGNEVTATKVAAADITAADASRLVRFEGLTFVSQETVSNKVNYTLNDGTTNIVLRDNYNNLSKIMWNADCKYNLNVFVVPFKETIQYYAVSADDVEVISTLEVPTFAWAESKIVTHVGESVSNTLRTNTDGAVTYTTSDEAVATVAADGAITVVGTGVATITATSEKTATYMGATASFSLAVISNADGTAENPYTVSDIKALYVDGDTVADVWVKAYIVGYADGAFNEAKTKFTIEEGAEVPASNVLIAASADETNYQNCLPIALETKPAECKTVREEVNLKDNPANLGKEVWFHGSIIKYFSVAGLKSVNAYSFTQPTEAQIEDVNGDGSVDTQDVLAVYEFMQSYEEGKAVDGYDVNGDGGVDTQDVLTIYEVMQNQ